jgi:hypothetical protein
MESQEKIPTMGGSVLNQTIKSQVEQGDVQAINRINHTRLRKTVRDWMSQMSVYNRYMSLKKIWTSEVGELRWVGYYHLKLRD